MVNEAIRLSVMKNICALHEVGHQVIVVHGGGPFINQIPDKVEITSEFIGGHRKTTPEAMKYIDKNNYHQINQ